MARTLATIKSLINSKLGKVGGTLGATDFLNGLNLALDSLRQEIDFPEATKVTALSPALFKDVYAYNPPSDLYGDAILDVRPYAQIPGSSRKNDWARNTNTEWDVNLLGDRARGKYTIEYNAGVKTVKLLKRDNVSLINLGLNNCDTYNGNGTWTADATTDALNVQTDLTNYVEGSGAVSFDITVGQSVNNYATIYNGGMNTIDTSINGTVSYPYLFFYVYLPSVTNLTSVQMFVGSDASSTPSTKANYYTFTATTQFGGSALITGWNLIGLPKSGATSTGTPADATIRYLELKINYSASYASQTGARLDGIFYRQGELHEFLYYSTNLVATNGVITTLAQYFANDDDTLILNSDGERLFIDYATGYLAPNVRDIGTGRTFMQLGQLAIQQYKMRYPIQRKLTMRNWYGETFD